MKYIVTHSNWQADQRLIGTFNTQEEAGQAISADLRIREIKPYYMRCWECRKNVTQIDYGSHNEFYFVKKVED